METFYPSKMWYIRWENIICGHQSSLKSFIDFILFFFVSYKKVKFTLASFKDIDAF